MEPLGFNQPNNGNKMTKTLIMPPPIKAGIRGDMQAEIKLAKRLNQLSCSSEDAVSVVSSSVVIELPTPNLTSS